MATYQLVMNNTWDDPAFQRWSAHAKLLFLNLITSHRHNPLGLYAVTLKTLSDETLLSPEQTDAAMQELQQPVFGYARIQYDSTQCLVWIVNALKHQKGITPHNARMLQHLVSVSHQYRDSRLFKAFCAHYRHDEVWSWIVMYIQGASKGPPRGLQGASKGVKRIGKDRIGKDRIGKEGKEEVQEKENPSRDSHGTVTGQGGRTVTVSATIFDRFWDRCPRKIGKLAAQKCWSKIDPSLHDLIIAAMERQCVWPQWTKDGGQFIPHPATWLNGRRWEDEAPTQPTGPQTTTHKGLQNLARLDAKMQAREPKEPLKATKEPREALEAP